ncbi:MAG TPA: urea carboxylase-associated family protein [Gemmatimonadaceae bacterium]|nr:urea carboxylase-associated family protein [Gemmatimonadaceae bacterium]
MTDPRTTSLHLAAQTGTAFLLGRGDLLEIIDVEGEQVADVTAFAGDDPTEWLSSGRTIDYANTIYVTAGHTLYSNRSRAMFTIVADAVGRHDFLLTPCSPEMFAKLYHTTGHHPSCFENLARALAPFGIMPNAIPTTFNVFMNLEILASGELRLLPPRSRAGDSILLRAEMPLVVGVTACSAENSNNGRFKPIDLVIRAVDGAARSHAAPSASASA